MRMPLTIQTERRLLQAAVILGGLVPITAGSTGMLRGCAMVAACADASLDNHVRYLSGLLAGLGLVFWWMVPHIERHITLARALTFMVILGGIARLVSACIIAQPSAMMLGAIGMELVVTPALCLWQARIARLHAQSAIKNDFIP